MAPPAATAALLAPLLWSVAPWRCYGLRDGLRDESRQNSTLQRQPDYTIHLVVTRHGLSCANIVSDFDIAKKATVMQYGKKFAGGHRNVADPILARVGVQASLEMRNVTQDVKPDAVLASPLLRAIETAILQYPSDTLHIVPHIREMSGMVKYHMSEGADNLPTPVATQMERLKKELDASQVLAGRSIETIKFNDWTTEETRIGNHDWELFKNFLANTFLPDLIPQLQKPLGSSITLAVVTHSNFMKETPDIKANCAEKWDRKGFSKPLNNQALSISYNAMSEGSNLTLTQNPGCTEVAGGVPYKKRKLCLHDIGESCRGDIKAKSLSLPDLVEMGVDLETRQYEKRIADLTQKIVEKMDPQELGLVSDQEKHFLNVVKPLKDQLKELQAHPPVFSCIASGESPDPEACGQEVLRRLCE